MRMIDGLLYRRAVKPGERNDDVGWSVHWIRMTEWLIGWDDWWIDCTGELSSLVKEKRMLVDRNTGFEWLSDWLDADDWFIGCTGEMSTLVKRMMVDRNTGLGWLSDWLDADYWVIDWMRMIEWLIGCGLLMDLLYRRAIDWLGVQESCRVWWRLD